MIVDGVRERACGDKHRSLTRYQKVDADLRYHKCGDATLLDIL